MNWFHRHRWSPVAVRKALDHNLHAATIVLYRCQHCTKIKTKLLRGVWTLEDVTPPITDLEFFKKLGVKL